MANYQPVPLDQLPIPQAAEQTPFQPAQLSPTPASSEQPSGAGYMGRGGQIADLGSNFLQGWLKGKQMASAHNLAMAKNNVDTAHQSFLNDQERATQIMNDPNKTPEEKKLADETRKKSWGAYLDIAQQYTEPEKTKGKGGAKGAMSGMAEHFKKALGTEDPHLFAQAGLALLRSSGPPPIQPLSTQEKSANIDLAGKQNYNKAMDEYESAIKRGMKPDSDEAKALYQKVRMAYERMAGPQTEKADSVRDVTAGQPLPGEAIGKEKGTYWWPQLDNRTGQTVGYTQTGPPKQPNDPAEERKKEETIQAHIDSTGQSRQRAEKWYAGQVNLQMEHKTNPPPTTSVVVENVPGQGPSISRETKTGKGVTPSSVPPSDLSGNWAIPKEGRTAIAKSETDYQNSKTAYDMAQKTLQRIQKDPSYAAQGDVLLLSQHVGMTLHQAGVRPTQTMWQEAIKARPWLQGVQVHIQGGLVTGATLTPQQRQQMVQMLGDRTRESQDSVNDQKTRYGLMVKVQSPDGAVGYIDKKKFDAEKDGKYKGFTVVRVE